MARFFVTTGFQHKGEGLRALTVVPHGDKYLFDDPTDPTAPVASAETSWAHRRWGRFEQQVPLDMRSLVLEHNLLMMLASLSTQHS